jgi:uncharacterized protein
MDFRGIAQAAFFLALSASCATAALADVKDKQPINYTVDGGTATGYFKVVAEALNGVVRESYPGSAATYKPGSPAGGIQNIATGQSDIVFTAAAPEIAYAIEGKAPFKEPLKDKLRFVMLLHNGLTVHNIATKEWADRNGIKSFADIAAKKPQMRLAVNQLANLQSTVAMYIAYFEAFGIDEKAVTDGGKNIFRGNSAQGMDALRDGKIDVFINGGFVPTAEITDIARGRPLVWISADAAKAKQIADKWGNGVLTVPKGAYPFVEKDEITTTQWNAMLAGKHVTEETVYKFLKAMADNRDRVRTIHPSLAKFALEDAQRNPTQLAYHPGAVRFYRDAGIAK